jgi:hypothetical protein
LLRKFRDDGVRKWVSCGSSSESRPISRVLSGAIIHLGLLSPASSSDLPEDTAGRDIVFLFGLAPGGVFHATNCYQLRGALLPHHFTLTRSREGFGRYIFCCTFRRLAPPRNYLAPCPVEPGLSSFPHERKRDCLAGSRAYCPSKTGRVKEKARH